MIYILCIVIASRTVKNHCNFWSRSTIGEGEEINSQDKISDKAGATQDMLWYLLCPKVTYFSISIYSLFFLQF